MYFNNYFFNKPTMKLTVRFFGYKQMFQLFFLYTWKKNTRYSLFIIFKLKKQKY